MLSFEQFREMIWDHYAHHRRSFPWREEISPYRVFVSEVMLQQTQADRVIKKFENFVAELPDFNALANAQFSVVLSLWKGLGYNRRALALKQAAQIICDEEGGTIPNDEARLLRLPSIGKATAASIIAFAFNKPTFFIETNIRSVFINAFFTEQSSVHDRDIMIKVVETMDYEDPRSWYYALTDYGVMLKKTMCNPGRKSAHYHRQSRFLGSDRQLRGKILEVLLTHHRVNKAKLVEILNDEPQRIFRMVTALRKDGLVNHSDDVITIA